MAQAEEGPKPVRKGCPELSELSEDEKQTTLSWWGKSGQLEMNPVALAKIIEDEGFNFVNRTSFDPTVPESPVVCVHNDDSKSTNGTVYYRAGPNRDAIGLLFKAGDETGLKDTALKLHAAATKQYIVSWLESSGKVECCICWEEAKGGSGEPGEVLPLIDDIIMCSTCGKFVCVDCVLGLALGRGDGLSYVCPNCQSTRRSLDNAIHLIEIINQKSSSLEGLSGEQKQLVFQWTAYDGTNGKQRMDAATGILQNLMRQLTIARMFKYGEKWRKHQEWTEEDYASMESRLKAGLRKLDRVSAKVEVVSAATSAVPKKASRNGCANCGKSFWDKKARQRAPKCTKCAKAAYCNSKCRKKHAKTHLKDCKALAKRKPKRKKKPKKKKCAPY